MKNFRQQQRVLLKHHVNNKKQRILHCGMPVLQWITFHRFWLVILLIMIPLAWKTSRTMLYPLAFALAYHLSYLVAVTAASDYRMLYPSTILIQITTLAWLLGGGWGMLRKKEASGQGVSCPTR